MQYLAGGRRTEFTFNSAIEAFTPEFNLTRTPLAESSTSPVPPSPPRKSRKQTAAAAADGLHRFHSARKAIEGIDLNTVVAEADHTDSPIIQRNANKVNFPKSPFQLLGRCPNMDYTSASSFFTWVATCANNNKWYAQAGPPAFSRTRVLLMCIAW